MVFICQRISESLDEGKKRKFSTNMDMTTSVNNVSNFDCDFNRGGSLLISNCENLNPLSIVTVLSFLYV